VCSKSAFDKAAGKEAKKQPATLSSSPNRSTATASGGSDGGDTTYGDAPLTPGKDGSTGGLAPNPVSTDELLALCEAAGPRRVFITRDDDDASLGIRMCVV
jgi:hypothetical protein